MRTRIQSINVDGRVMPLQERKAFFGQSVGVRCASSANTANRMTAKRAADLRRKAALVREYKEKEERRKAHSALFDERMWAEKFKYA